MLACARRACAPRAARPQQERAIFASGHRAQRHHLERDSVAVAVARRAADAAAGGASAAAAAAAAATPARASPAAAAAPPPPPPPKFARAFGRLALVFVAAAAVAAAASLSAPDAALAAAGKGAAAAVSSAAADEPLLSRLLSALLHFDEHLSALVETNPRATYAVLFAIVFAETGLIVTPFLPGDSLLFAAGAFAGMGKLALWPLAATLATAAVFGDAVNYAIGRRLGEAALGKGWIAPQHVAQTQRYYAKYGAKTIVLARFVPIVRTFAPFVAGVGSMDYKQFASYNVGGALLWTALFVGAGAAFGNLPAVKSNFKLVVVGIIVVSVIPVLVEVWNARKEAERERRNGGGGGGAAASA